MLSGGTVAAETAAAPASVQFSEWSIAARAKGDTFGYCSMLAFHIVTLVKWRSFPTLHIVYFICYIAATLAALAWHRSGHPSYAAWRDWIQAAVRLECHLSPIRTSLWKKSVQSPPPAVPAVLAHACPAITPFFALPGVLANTVAINLLLVPLIHTLSFWPHVAVQLVCVSRLVYSAGSMQGCATPFFRHPTTRCLLGQAYEWLQLLTLFTPGPLPVHGRSSVAGTRCDVVVRWFQIMAGFVASVLLQARIDTRAHSEWQQSRHRNNSGHTTGGLQMLANPQACPQGVSGLQFIAAAAQQPCIIVMVAAIVWDVLCFQYG